MAEEIAIRKSPLRQMRDYFADVRVEMKRVTWPGKQEVYGTTLMVVLTTFFFAFYFYLCDSVFRYAILRTMDFFLHRG